MNRGRFLQIPVFRYSGGAIKFADSFTRDDQEGEEIPASSGEPWYSPGGGTIAIASNALVVTPTQGAELLVNGDFSAWTGDNPDGWAVLGEVGADPSVSEVAAGEFHADAPTPGGQHANLYSSATNSQPGIRQNVLSANTWIISVVDINGAASGTLIVQDQGGIGTIATYTTSGAKTATSRIAGTNYRLAGVFAATDITLASASVKQLTLSTLFALRAQAFTNAYAQAAITRTAYTQAGVVHYADADNFVIAYLNGDDKVKLVKCVAGVYTEVGSANITYGAGQVLKLSRSGTNYTIDYNGVEAISATAITDSVFTSAKTWGLFSTYDGNSFDDYEWGVN